MTRKPKYKQGDIVQFEFNGKVKNGTILIVDANGIYYDKKNVYYDLMVEEEECLHKHICEKDVIALIEESTNE